ncbi:hypothetical protein M433DRAFT_312920 [Acidomyces richmondensis BFW]|nr:hypothetical protein M433DRAFT_312920 [Acidomyces richmondensis BFW]
MSVFCLSVCTCVSRYTYVSTLVLPPPSRVMLDYTSCDPCQASSPPDTRACARPALGQTPLQ